MFFNSLIFQKSEMSSIDSFLSTELYMTLIFLISHTHFNASVTFLLRVRTGNIIMYVLGPFSRKRFDFKSSRPFGE